MMSLMTQLNFAQNAPTSTYEGTIIIDKPVPGGLGLKVEGGSTWLHNDDNGANSNVLQLGINKNWNAPTMQIFTTDGGGHNGIRFHATRWGTSFSWTRGSHEGLQYITRFGSSNDSGQYFRLYGNAPDTAQVVKIELRTKGNSYLDTNGNFGLGTKTPTDKLDVNGDARTRGLHTIGGDFSILALSADTEIDNVNVSSIQSSPKPLILNGNELSIGVGICGVPENDVSLDVHKGQNDAPIRVRNLPPGNFPIVTVDDTGVFHISDFTPYNLPVPPPEGDHLGNHQATQILNMNENKIINLDDPIEPLDAVNKFYVDTQIATAVSDTDVDLIVIIAQLQAQIDELSMKVEALENQ